jgi:hypothetical protein
MTRRKRTGPPPLMLTRVPSYDVNPVAGWDADGNDWIGIDATKHDLPCERCGRRIEYGYQPWRSSAGLAHCNRCVEFRDGSET